MLLLILALVILGFGLDQLFLEWDIPRILALIVPVGIFIFIFFVMKIVDSIFRR